MQDVQWTAAPRSAGTPYFATAQATAQAQGVCWHCCSPFDGPIHPMPVAFDARKRFYTFVGCFCGWSCVKGHNLEVNAGKYVHREVCMHIARLMTQTGAPDCAAAPPRTCLSMFGGHLRIEQFRGSSRSSACAPPPAGRAPPVLGLGLGRGLGDRTSTASRGGGQGGQGGRAGIKRGRAPENGHMRLEQLGFVSRA